MEDLTELRARLVAYMRKKFYTRRNAAEFADEIVNQAFLDVAAAGGDEGRYNFGYMATACLRRAYKVFHRNDVWDGRTAAYDEAVSLIDEAHFVQEIEQAEDTAAIVASLDVLKEVERVIVRERYFGDFTFREIGERHDIKLNTVLTHHRRALNKLRPILTNVWRQL